MSEENDFAQLAEDLAPEDLRAVLAVFASDVQRLVVDLASAAGAGDVATFRRVAHGLAGASGAVGAKEMDMACRSAMTRRDLTPCELVGLAVVIKQLSDSALLRLAAFIDRLDAAENTRP